MGGYTSQHRFVSIWDLFRFICYGKYNYLGDYKYPGDNNYPGLQRPWLSVITAYADYCKLLRWTMFVVKWLGYYWST